MKDLGADAQRLGERRGADRHHHELLEVDARIGVRAAVQDVHHRHGQREPVVLVERRRCAGRAAMLPAAASARSAAIETPSSALAPSRLLVGVPSSAIIASSSAALIEVAAVERRGDLAVDVGDGLAHAFAAVARLVAVAQFERFALAGRRARRHRRAPHGAAVERDVDFDGRVAARIQNLPSVHSCDLHGRSFVELRLQASDFGLQTLRSLSASVGLGLEPQRLLIERPDRAARRRS